MTSDPSMTDTPTLIRSLRNDLSQAQVLMRQAFDVLGEAHNTLNELERRALKAERAAEIAAEWTPPMTQAEIEAYGAEDEAIDAKIEAWHHGAGGEAQPLHDYLGWTEAEYAAWVKDPNQKPRR